ncbi:MAG: glutamate synthase, partial [Lachnospiraceae bacterium]|nr:glutamate synthase [Lachnospiraceae bacterium]
VGNFPCTGMHGGKMFLRGSCEDIHFPKQVTARCAAAEELDEIREYLSEYCSDFGYSADELLSKPFTVITPDSKNPYKQMYVAN